MTRRRMMEEQPQETTLPLHLKYRPQTFKDVRGQDAVVKSLKAALEASAKPHVFMFAGPAGTGKTSLARIVASACGVPATGIVEIDAATNTGIDAMRDIQAPLQYQGFGSSPNKMVIIDEAHGLSKQAMDSMLKTLEEPPEHVYFALCTTEPSKLKVSSLRRCLSYTLKPCNVKTLEDLLFDVCDAEGYKTPDSVVGAAADAANGSPGLALMNLAKVHACTDVEEAEDLLQAVGESKEIIDICRQLITHKLTWRTLRDTLKAMPSPDAESIRIVISCYLAVCVQGAKDDRDIRDLCAIAYRFSKPFNPTDKMMPLFLAFDELIGG